MIISKKFNAVLSFNEKGKPQIIVEEGFLRRNVKEVKEICNGSVPQIRYLKPEQKGFIIFSNANDAYEALWSIPEEFPEIHPDFKQSEENLKHLKNQQEGGELATTPPYSN